MSLYTLLYAETPNLVLQLSDVQALYQIENIISRKKRARDVGIETLLQYPIYIICFDPNTDIDGNVPYEGAGLKYIARLDKSCQLEKQYGEVPEPIGTYFQSLRQVLGNLLECDTTAAVRSA